MSAVDEGQVLRETFIAVFRPASPLPFGSEALGTPGLCDGNFGVQWNAWIDLRLGAAYVGVNLEGKEYNGWPIARLIRSELAASKLFETIARLQQPNEIEVVWWRDAWGAGGSRIPSFKEHCIAPTPTMLSTLTEEGWTLALREARSCLNAARNYQGRVKQSITLLDGRRIEHQWVSPHLQFRRQLWQQSPTDASAREKGMQAARDQLQPLFEFVKERCA